MVCDGVTACGGSYDALQPSALLELERDAYVCLCMYVCVLVYVCVRVHVHGLLINL